MIPKRIYHRIVGESTLLSFVIALVGFVVFWSYLWR
jgi:hypothetical protein